MAVGGAIALQPFSSSDEEDSEELLPSSTSDYPRATPSRSRARCLIFLVPLLALLVLGLAHALYAGVPFLDRLTTATRAAEAQREEGTEQRVVQWTKQDSGLRAYEWETPGVHQSLQKKLDALSQSENRTRSWLIRTRLTSTAGVGIGLGSAEPPELIRPGAAAPFTGEFPRPDEGPGEFGGGSKGK